MKIQEICKIVNGSTPSTSNESFWDGDIPWITPKDMSFLQGRYIGKGSRNITKAGYDSCSTTMLPTNAVLLTSRAPIGYVAIASNPVCTNQGFKSLLCNPKFVLAEYMYYWLSSKTAYVQSIAGGSTFKELSKDQLGSAEIDLPSIETQRHIVDAIASLLRESS